MNGAANQRALVKVCGVTRVADAEACADLDVDWIGLNFYPPSPRFVTTEQARRIAQAVRSRVGLVGVFVNRDAEEVRSIDQEVGGLDGLQFHGDESATYVGGFGGRALPAIRVRPDRPFSRPPLESYPDAWGFLFDVAVDGTYGGTGERWAYELLAEVATERPTLVAGGIRPGQAAAAMARSRRSGVDVCSGVESAPGVKDHAAIESLVREVRGG